MKQMNKEELIDYFIEQLGDNEVIGKIMTKEQIRDKLNILIKNVDYKDEEGNSLAHWKFNQDGTGEVNFDNKKIPFNQEKVVIIHELLHALSSTSNVQDNNKYYLKKYEKCGIRFSMHMYHKNEEESGFPKLVALNEGMTDALAEEIAGVEHNGYNREKDIYKIISIVVGKENMLKKYFSEEVLNYESALDIFKSELIEKYGEDIGNEINDNLKKVYELSDQLLTLDNNDSIYGLNENGKRIQKETQKEIEEALQNILLKLLNSNQIKISELLASDVGNKGIFFENCIKEVVSKQLIVISSDEAINIFPQLKSLNLTDEFYSKMLAEGEISKENLNRLKQITFLGQGNNYVESEISEKFLNSIYDSEHLNFDEKLNILYRLGFHHDEIGSLVYQELIDKCEIKQGLAKEDMIYAVDVSIAVTLDDISEGNNILENFFYGKVGNYYRLFYKDKILPGYFNENGESLKERTVNGIFPIKRFLDSKSEEKIRIANTVNQLNDDGISICIIRQIGNDIILTDKSKKEYYYILNKENVFEFAGEFEDGEKGIRRRLIDDMSEIDIQLQEQTMDISVTEIMEEIENTQLAMNNTKQQTNEIQGEEIDGK